MLPSLRHPRLDQLSDFLATPRGESRARVAEHLQRCQRCRESLQLLKDASTAANEMPPTSPSTDLRARVLASRAGGVRTILPTADVTVPSRRRWVLPAAAAILVILAGALVTRRPNEIEAGTTSGTLTLTPAMPLPGQTIAVRYQPAALLSGQPWLALRARLRSPKDPSYNGGIPIVTVATLRRGADGSFTGTFSMPGSVVYAALAVEDSAATIIDDDGSRAWELLVADTAGRPRFEALDQRTHDMMGRNWEEGFATARRMTALYPRDLRAWSWLHSFHSWLGRAGDDSIRAMHRAALATFDSTFTHSTSLSDEDEGLIAWYAQGIDSAVAMRWRTRLLREAPSNSFAVQWRLFDILGSLRTGKDTTLAFRQLDALWTDAPRDRLAQIAIHSTNVAFYTGDTALIKRWTARLLAKETDPRRTARWIATQFANTPSLRSEGIRRLRAELDSLAQLPPSERALAEPVPKQRQRHAAERRELLATLGQALVAAGQSSAGRETLAEAAASGWNLDVFRAVRTASMAGGDTARALTMAARIVVDPRTAAAFADSVRPLAERRLGRAGWLAQLDSARAEYVGRMLADALPRSVPGGTRLRDLEGRQQTLRSLTEGQVTVVAFWSRFCVPAVEDLPRLNAVAARLAGSGVRVVGIVEEASASSELKSFLREKQVTMPTYLDAWHEASRAFNQWGTPYYYVLDADGRMRFDVTTSADEVLARAEALRLAARSGGALQSPKVK